MPLLTRRGLLQAGEENPAGLAAPVKPRKPTAGFGRQPFGTSPFGG